MIRSGQTAPTGAETMSPAMREMTAYPSYLYRQVESLLGQRVLEIGVGHGTCSQMMCDAGKVVLGTDIDPECLQRAAARFADNPAYQVCRVDLTSEPSVRALAEFRADSVICFNVLEHIGDDVAAMRWIRAAVTDDAVLALIVPAHQWLFGKMDSEAGHYRRYTCATTGTMLRDAGWQPMKLRYLNLVGAAGWWYNNRIRRNAGIADPHVNWQMRRADRWLPRFAKLTDPFFGRIAGLSVLAIARA